MTTYNDQLSDYITRTFVPESEPLRRIRAQTAEHGLPGIELSPEEGQFLHWLVRATGARRVVEIGTLGGYSGSCIALALPNDGRATLHTIEINPDHAAVAQRHFALAGVDDRVTVHVGAAREVLPTLTARGPFDLVFMDADRDSYPDYFTWIAENLRVGGTLAMHNAFANGKVLTDKPTIFHFNRQVAHDPRFTSTIYPAGDGMLIATRRA
ncbi:MAG: O-methyltransferase [Anaerolineales bacterium]|nr:O-methyltransferase [Anaerolineales bacterium]MCB9126931.1 O-methyltransferase [Ardenticatenales bacterium]MCB9171475.1 O-methyltransferase [Ardenticatenales bacterium]